MQSCESENTADCLEDLRDDENNKVAKNLMTNMFKSKKKKQPLLEKSSVHLSDKNSVTATTL